VTDAAPLTRDLPDEQDTIELARDLAPALKPGALLILSGPLGSGKTFLTRALCRALGLPEEARVPSPTFTLVHEHETTPPLAHADFYRLSDGAQVYELGLDAARDEGSIVVAEWGEPYLAHLGGDGLIVTLSLDPRRAALRATGPTSSAILEAVRNSGADDRGRSESG
jgi:tRNA threonylcarbamoyladenosine biosynthesis protein TsaE